jgi:aminoglycoside phosphotransferase (APT) family kinase protein
MPLGGGRRGQGGDYVVAYLTARGHLRPDEGAQTRVTRLTGGVSAETVLVESPRSRLVVKRALSRPRVAGEWRAKPGRAMAEAAAIRALGAITPDHVPRLLDADPLTDTLVMESAPAGWVNWKTVLLGECEDPTQGPAATAAVLGRVLGTWHAATRDDAALAARFRDDETFDQLRVTPFYRQIAAMHPAVADRVRACVAQLEDVRRCLVHGGYSPKNVLAGTDGLVVLDFAVARVGAGVFDVAFMQSHLLLKALRRPEAHQVLAAAGSAFLEAYKEEAREPLDDLLGTHVACLMLARVDGVSPAGYLTPGAAGRVRRLALGLLAEAEPDIGRVWAAAEAAA